MRILKLSSLLVTTVLFSACSVQVIEMTPEPTQQVFDLSDTEGDGIIQARDACPKTSIGAKIDNNGCSSESLYTVRHRLDINFDINSAKVKKEYISKVEQLSLFMKEFPQVNVIIEGHTSTRGGAVHNKVLSKHRALAVKEILVKQFDIAEERIESIGYGFEKPISHGYDEYSHERNRRIVAELSSDKKFTDKKWTIYSVDD